MKTIRHSIFETNSSSTHSITISKDNVDLIDLPNKINFKIGKFSWHTEEVNKYDYFYTALILCYENSNERDSAIESAIEHVRMVLENIGVKSSFELPKFDSDGYLENGYIDHNDTNDFIITLMNNDQMFIRFLFGDSHVYTGNDNEHYENENAKCRVAQEYVYEYNEKTNNYDYIKNKYHDETKYDYFYKGN